MLRKSFGRALALALVLCMFLGCCAFAMEGEAAQDDAGAPQDAVTEATNAEAEDQLSSQPGEVEALGENVEAAEGISDVALDAAVETSDAANEDADAAALEAELTAETIDAAANGIEALSNETCPHDNVDEYIYYSDATCVDIGDPYEHKVTGYRTVEHYCNDCDTMLDSAMASEVSEGCEEHYFNNGVCEKCGAKNSCAHENPEHCSYIDGVYEQIEGDANYHKVSGYPVEYDYCDVCGEEWEVSRGEWTETTEEHFFDNGVCDACGYKNQCAHQNVTKDDYYAGKDCEYISNDSKTHTMTGLMCHEVTCQDCGEILEYSIDTEETSRVEWHYFVNGVCPACGYQNACAHKYIGTTEQMTNETCTPINDKVHAVKGDLVRAKYCINCGEWFGREVVEKGKESVSRHFCEDGVCEMCGYEIECAHVNTWENSYVDESASKIMAYDEKGHTYVPIRTIKFVMCDDCGETLFEEIVEAEGEKVTEPHVLYGDGCSICDYVNKCAHKKTHTDESMYNLLVLSSDEKGHKLYCDYVYNDICDDCGSVLKTEEKYGTAWTEEHAYEGDSCTVCGYKKAQTAPTPTPETKPTPTPETEPTMPAVTDEPIVTPTPTMPAVSDTPKATPKATAKPTEAPAEPAYEEVPVEEELTIAETMIQVDADVAAQGGSVRIVNAEKVLTADEMTALNVLPVREQLLSFLSVIGFEEQVNRTLAARQESLSAGAEALKAQVLERIAAMDDAARAAFEAALLECFPQETVAVDGAEYNFFVIELEVRAGDSVRCERYGFRRDGDEWIFTRLEVAK